jgi:hypothetical protein
VGRGADYLRNLEKGYVRNTGYSGYSGYGSLPAYVLYQNDYGSFCRNAALMVGRYELHEWQWQLIRDLFPPPKATGRKRRDPTQMFNAILWILCSGAPWRDLPQR